MSIVIHWPVVKKTKKVSSQKKIHFYMECLDCKLNVPIGQLVMLDEKFLTNVRSFNENHDFSKLRESNVYYCQNENEGNERYDNFRSIHQNHSTFSYVEINGLNVIQRSNY